MQDQTFNILDGIIDDEMMMVDAHVASQPECDLLTGEETYTFDAETCRCTIVNDTPTTAEMCQMADIEKPFVSPIDDSECICKETLFALYEHGLGPDCINDTPDDGARGPQYCPPGFEYDPLFCSCAPTDSCTVECTQPMVENPLKCGECLTQEELGAMMDATGDCPVVVD